MLHDIENDGNDSSQFLYAIHKLQLYFYSTAVVKTFLQHRGGKSRGKFFVSFHSSEIRFSMCAKTILLCGL